MAYGLRTRTRMFQHTAARRRLPGECMPPKEGDIVSTHSRAEAAAAHQKTTPQAMLVSTHSRAEAAAWHTP